MKAAEWVVGEWWCLFGSSRYKEVKSVGTCWIRLRAPVRVIEVCSSTLKVYPASPGDAVRWRKRTCFLSSQTRNLAPRLPACLLSFGLFSSLSSWLPFRPLHGSTRPSQASSLFPLLR